MTFSNVTKLPTQNGNNTRQTDEQKELCIEQASPVNNKKQINGFMEQLTIDLLLKAKAIRE